MPERMVMTDQSRTAHRRQAQSGVIVSFDQFYRDRYGALSRALSATLGDVALGREATDEAMTRAYGRWNEVSTLDNPSGWVYRVGYNWAVSRLRRLSRSLPWAADPVELPTMPDVALQHAIERLDTKFRSVVVCRYLLDWSTRETAEALGIPANTVKSRLATALECLRLDLSDSHHPATADLPRAGDLR